MLWDFTYLCWNAPKDAQAYLNRFLATWMATPPEPLFLSRQGNRLSARDVEWSCEHAGGVPVYEAKYRRDRAGGGGGLRLKTGKPTNQGGIASGISCA